MHKLLRNVNIKHNPGHLFFAPEWLVLGVNNICNLHCKMCDVGTGYEGSNFAHNLVGSKPLNMPPELISMVIDQAARHYPKTKLGYAFTEPLIYPHLGESLRYAEQKGLYTSVTTNALTLQQKAEEIAEAGLNDIFISLDGPEEIHNFIRGNKSSFQKAVAGIEKLLSLGKRPSISVFCVITQWNTGHLKRFADFFSSYPLKELGFMHTNFTPAQVAEGHNLVYGNRYPATVSNMEEISIAEMDLDELFNEIKLVKSAAYPFPVAFSPNISTKEELDIFYKYPEKKIGRICNDAYRSIMIKTDGNVIPAHGRCFNLSIGNLYEQDLEKIWNSPVVSAFRKDLMKAGGLFPACSRCCSAF